MVVGGGKPTPEAEVPVEGKGSRNDSVLILDDSSIESEVAKLRGRWELASVLNFLIVFEPVIGSDLKLSAEEIELGLIKPNASIAALHIRLLQGTPPLSKLLKDSDGWMTALCKKLTMWWPWVAEGEILLTARNGEEISKYKELDPTSRLLLLKALCEIRADQNDAVSYINDAMKSNKETSCFRKEKIGANGNVSYWYDGNTVFGYRLYREVKKMEPQSKAKGKARLTLPTVCSHWETLAVDFKEFREVVDTLMASKIAAEVAIGKTINDDVIPVVEKFQKKKERALNRKKRQEMLLSSFRSSSCAGITRTCRNRRPVSYTFDEYDRAIDEAIEITKRRKTIEVESQGQKLPRQTFGSNGGSDVEGSVSKDRSDGKANSMGSDTEDNKLQKAGDNGNEKEDDDDDYSSRTDGDDNNSSNLGSSADENENLNNENHKKHMSMGSRRSKRLAGVDSHPAVRSGNFGTKNRSRQRPVVNSALETIVPDSEDDISSDHTM
ncbi:DDT domain-containing protein DDR4-like isoform X1 [Hibiscus syriacus]|uniref:DDT domain-containing protein DDR4-like isoform X1 n=1 Tax=Hibiscus syriacus TaxID=106335 RepID=UPI0019207111|nr:DDT domain-containing protein DDR4-like isoform X1 [Hibiscus syriacus]